MQVQIGNADWILSAGRSAFWLERRWLVVADLHFGKAATFRALGVPVPHGTTSDTLSRLSDLIDRMQPNTVVFLGDLFHAREAHAVPTLAALHSGASVMQRLISFWWKAITIAKLVRRRQRCAFAENQIHGASAASLFATTRASWTVPQR